MVQRARLAQRCCHGWRRSSSGTGAGVQTLRRRSSHSLFAGTAPCAADPILGLVAAFLTDPSPTKVNLAQGAYRTEEGQPLLLSAVRKAEERVVARSASKEYLGAQPHGHTRTAPQACRCIYAAGGVPGYCLSARTPQP
jgi:hypothetical protein